MSQKADIHAESGAAFGSAAHWAEWSPGLIVGYHQVLPQKVDLVLDDLRAHIRAVEVEVGAGIDFEFAMRRVIRYLACQLHR